MGELEKIFGGIKESMKEKKPFFVSGFKKLPLWYKYEALKLAVKYYFQGDEWHFAQEYAISLVKGWRRIKNEKKT